MEEQSQRNLPSPYSEIDIISTSQLTEGENSCNAMFQVNVKIQFEFNTDLLGSKVYEEREKEDHETVEKKAEQG